MKIIRTTVSLLWRQMQISPSLQRNLSKAGTNNGLGMASSKYLYKQSKYRDCDAWITFIILVTDTNFLVTG